MKLSRYFGTREFLRSAVLLTLPILIQNLLTTSSSLVDTLMVSSLGTVELTATGLAASWVSIMNVILFGISTAAGVLIAQYWGGNALRELRHSYGIGLCLGLGVSLVFLSLTLFFPRQVMLLYSTDPTVIQVGAGYLRTVALGFPAVAVQQVSSVALRSTGRVRIPMYGTVLSVVLNVFLNYSLIFGRFGFPALGLQGAATASVLANWAGAGVTYALALTRDTVLRTTLRHIFGFHPTFVRHYLSVAWPVMLNEMLWAIGTAIENMIFGHMGTTEYAALTVCTTVEHVVTMVFLSLSSSVAVLVGNEIGRGNKEKAYENALVVSCWTPILAAGFGLLLIALRGSVVGIFQQSAQVTVLAGQLLLVSGCLMPIRLFQYIHICGVLRAAADGRRAAMYDFIGIWCVSIPLALCGLLLGLPIVTVYLMVYFADGAVKDILVLRRFRSKKWMRSVAQ